MNIIGGGRTQGRSHMMLEHAQKWQVQNPNQRIMVICVDARECDRLYRQSLSMTTGHVHTPGLPSIKPILERSQFVTPDRSKYSRGVSAPVYVDNADVILERLLGQRIHTVTIVHGLHDMIRILD